LFGYPWGRISRALRVRRHIENIRATSINLCVFFVGHEPGFNGTFTSTQAISAQHAIDLMRELYQQAGIGVRRIFWRYIHDDDAAPYLSVNASGATDLTEAYSGPNDGIDLFLVQMITDAGGWSNSEGPCDKSDKGRTGAVVSISITPDDFLGIVVAHEVGHYLGLKHTNSATNLMGVDVDNDGVGELTMDSRVITDSQRTTMRVSCWVRDPC
jgi:hypothetical protein